MATPLSAREEKKCGYVLHSSKFIYLGSPQIICVPRLSLGAWERGYLIYTPSIATWNPQRLAAPEDVRYAFAPGFHLLQQGNRRLLLSARSHWARRRQFHPEKAQIGTASGKLCKESVMGDVRTHTTSIVSVAHIFPPGWSWCFNILALLYHR